MNSEIEEINVDEIVMPGWTVIRDECISEGQVTPDCNFIAATQGAPLVFTMRKLACGCVMIKNNDGEDIIL